jgi:tetratricopeptide (TPR) repeat protein
MAIKILFDEENCLETDEKQATDLIEEIGIPVHLNMALCFLNLEDWNNVIFFCNKVLELKPDNIKALYRRCRAFLKMKNLEKAAKDIQKLEQELPGNSEELKYLKTNYEEIENEKGEGLYQTIGKKIVKINKKPENKVQIQETMSSDNYFSYFQKVINEKKNSSINKCNELMKIIPNKFKKIISSGLHFTFYLPLNLAIKSLNLAKNILYDLPCEICNKALNLCIVNPTKFVINRIKFIKLRKTV